MIIILSFKKKSFLDAELNEKWEILADGFKESWLPIKLTGTSRSENYDNWIVPLYEVWWKNNEQFPWNLTKHWA